MINEMLGTKYPIIQGGMANIALGKFAAAVSNAGGLGLIGSGGYDAARIEQEIYDARKATDKPFGVNLMLLNPDVDNIADLLVKEKIKILIAEFSFAFFSDSPFLKPISINKAYVRNPE